MLRFKCPKCQRVLSAKEEQAGKRAACPGCKTPFVVPVPKKAPAAKVAADADKLAADILAQSEAAEAAARAPQKIEMECPYCFEQIKFPVELAGKQIPCPSCKRIVKVDQPKKEVVQNWREAARTGPQFARDNVEKKLDDVISTSDRTGVHTGSLEQAGALPEPKAEPAGVGTWIRRVAIVVVILCFLVGAFFVASSLRQETANKSTLEVAMTSYEKVKDKMPRSWKAEFHRMVGEFHASQSESDEARKQFYAARFQFPPGLPNLKPATYEDEVVLIEVAKSQAAMGGTNLAWDEVPREIERTFAAIYSEEGKLIGVRRVCLQLLKKDQGAIALSVAQEVKGNRFKSLVSAQGSLQFALKSPDQAKALLPPLEGKKALALAARLGYAEGKAHEGNFEEARRIAGSGGVALDRLKALLALAEVALHYNNTDEAKRSFDQALKVAVEDLKKRGITPLTTYHIVWLGTRVDSPDMVQEWVERIADPELKALAQFEVLRGQSKDNSADIDLEKITSKESLGYALAVLWKLKHNPSQSASLLAEQDETLHPLIHAAQLLKE